MLLDHYDTKGFLALGGSRSDVYREWRRLNTLIVRDNVLRTLPLHVLFSRLFLHFAASHHNALLLAALVQVLAIDATLSDQGMSVQRALKAEGTGYKGQMLLYLLGHAWEAMGAGFDVRAISVESLVRSWVEKQRLGGDVPTP